ncbi:MAG: F0F1 ATP synthase subunit delta [Gammaproteobacteria bacterium]|nr:MAG: F0F1 ATP synthase subunit delta [Gammaproteobacteria bacterium]
MAEAITIARPYATAAFAIANDKGELKKWSDLLAVLAQAVTDPSMQSVISSPSVSDEQVLGLLAELAGESMSEEAQNFLALLAENNRLQSLQYIAVIFEELLAEAEQIMTADVTTARALTPEQEGNISAALKKRLGRDITLNTSVDETLLGGAIIRAGDLIIDGSALGKLNRLANAIS